MEWSLDVCKNNMHCSSQATVVADDLCACYLYLCVSRGDLSISYMS